jgi:hypothetical protein
MWVAAAKNVQRFHGGQAGVFAHLAYDVVSYRHCFNETGNFD